MTEFNRLLESVLAAKQQGKLGFMLDLDGATVHRPPAIHTNVPYEPAVDLALSRLLDQGCHVSINTGRPLIFVENIFPQTIKRLGTDPNFWVSNENGARIEGGTGYKTIRGLDNIPELTTHFNALSKPWTGTVIEVGKEHSITISAAKATEKEAAFYHLKAKAEDLSNQTGEFTVIAGLTETDAYIELVNPKANKGSAANIIISQGNAKDRVIYAFGDSAADKAMQVQVQKHNGFAVGVGTRAPEGANFYIHSYHETQQILLAAALG